MTPPVPVGFDRSVMTSKGRGTLIRELGVEMLGRKKTQLTAWGIGSSPELTDSGARSLCGSNDRRRLPRAAERTVVVALRRVEVRSRQLDATDRAEVFVCWDFRSVELLKPGCVRGFRVRSSHDNSPSVGRRSGCVGEWLVETDETLPVGRSTRTSGVAQLQAYSVKARCGSVGIFA
jgi:hypothetical protein